MKLFSMAFAGPKGYNRYVEGEKPSVAYDYTFHNTESNQDIKEKTGFEFDKHIGWFYEIQDGDLIPDSIHIGETKTLGEIYNAPEVYKAYPQLKRLKVTWTDYDTGDYGNLWKNARGVKYQTKYITNMAIYINGTLIKNLDDEFKSTLIHEIQHAIQTFEDYNMGEKTSFFTPSEKKDFDKRLYARFNAFKILSSLIRNLYPDELYRKNENDDGLYLVSLSNVFINHKDDILKFVDEKIVPLFDERYDDIVTAIQFLNDYGEKYVHDNSPYYKYKITKHETQARNASKRMRMSPEERRKSLALSTEDVPFDEQTYSPQKIKLRDENSWE